VRRSSLEAVDSPASYDEAKQMAGQGPVGDLWNEERDCWSMLAGQKRQAA
jgi:hypothetical protein